MQTYQLYSQHAALVGRPLPLLREFRPRWKGQIRRDGHSRCKVQAVTVLQAQIQEITTSLPLQGWPLAFVTVSCAALASYTALKILIWDYRNRRTDDPTEADRSASYSLRVDPPAGQEPPPAAKAFDWSSSSYRAKANGSAISQGTKERIAQEAAAGLMACIREARTVQSELLREGDPLKQLCAKGFADPGMAVSWQISGCDSEADYVRLLMGKAVQNVAMEQIRIAAQELGRIQASSGINK